jgi:hypothetical protein
VHISVCNRTGPREKRFEELGRTQKGIRLKTCIQAIIAVARQLQVPLSRAITVLGSNQVKTVNMLHIATSDREKFRTIEGVDVPSEKLFRKMKMELSRTHATETEVFRGKLNGAYITDPLRFARLISTGSPFLAIGGDAGGGTTKLGVTYIDKKGATKFAALVVWPSPDTHDELKALFILRGLASVTRFVGESAPYESIWDILQKLIDDRPNSSYLSGDWPFISAVIGHQGHSASFPCPICTVPLRKLQSMNFPYRTEGTKLSMIEGTNNVLLRIKPEFIIPTPLHIFLGLGNRIVGEALAKVWGTTAVGTSAGSVLTKHTRGCGGLSDLNDFNGPELCKYIEKDRAATLLLPHTSSEKKRAHDRLVKWLNQLKATLLHKNEWTRKDIDQWAGVVKDMQDNWEDLTGQKPFPQLHMLGHTVEFAERFRFLGRVSESATESYHASYNNRYHNHHMCSASNEPRRHRRSLADLVLNAIQPIVQADAAEIEVRNTSRIVAPMDCE